MKGNLCIYILWMKENDIFCKTSDTIEEMKKGE